MKSPDKMKQNDSHLRAMAEAKLEAAQSTGAPARPAEELLHELQVHQIELEMQNETLRQSQMALEASRDRYVDLYDLAPVGYLTLTDQGLIAEINLTGAAMLGTHRAKLLQRRFSASVAAADRDRWHRHFINALGQDAKLDCEVVLLRPDGSRLVVRVDSLRLAKEGETPVLRAVLIDITEEGISQAALHRSEKFGVTILDSLSAQLAVLDRDGVIVAVNEPWRRFALENSAEPGNMPRNTGIGVNYLHVCQASVGDSSELARQAHDGILMALEGRLPNFRLEYPCHSVSQQRWFAMSVTPLDTTDRGVVVLHTDITERKLMEQALAETEERFSLFMDTLPAGAFIKEEDSSVVYANRFAAEIIGVRAGIEESSGKPFLHRSAEKTIGDDRRAIEAGYLVVEEQMPGRDGQMRHYETRKFTIPRQGLRPLLGGIAIDITKRKRAEEQLRELAASFEEKVIARTRQLRTLSAQLAMTEERERRQLAQDLHDNLGQLLAVIKIKLTALVAGSLQSPVDQIVDLVHQADQSARMITMRLSPPILHTLGFVPALEWLVDEMARMYGITVHFDDERAPKPLVDEIQAMLYRCVRELLINVARHARVGEASLYCHCDGSRLMLVVSDDGCGFDPAHFHDALPGQGTFGLNSIYERVTNIGGEMEIDSSPGNGTTVTLTVPCSIVAMEHQP